ncbi:MAG: Rieske 2Fe-2S domain-containing protein [Phycisphaerales bacterium]
MSASYTTVGWNRVKKRYDAIMLAGIGVFLALFIALGALLVPSLSFEILLIRALAVCAILMLHIVLAIGPLARLSRFFMPALYNRRHLGVATFLVGLFHAALATGWYHAGGDVNPIVSLLTANTRVDSLRAFPFEWPGMGALLILFLMAATSHDFWLANLSPRVWKTLHMLVYAAYFLLVAHVSLGVLQSERSPLYPALLVLGALTLISLHLAAARKQRRIDRELDAKPKEGFVDVGAIDEMQIDRAVSICVQGERIAVFRHGEQGEKISAVANRCAHQHGPLAEGKIVDGCITCPWHGYQYVPETGCSPPPFTEKVTTYSVRIVAGRVLVNPNPNPPAPASDVSATS